MILCGQHQLWYSVDSTSYDILLTAPVMILCWQHQLWYSVDRTSRGGDSAQRGRETGLRVHHTQVTLSPAPAAPRTHRGTQSPGVMMRRVDILFILQAKFLLSVLWFRALKWWGWCNGYCSGTKSAMSACVCNPEGFFSTPTICCKICLVQRHAIEFCLMKRTNEWLFINNNNKKTRLAQPHVFRFK